MRDRVLGRKRNVATAVLLASVAIATGGSPLAAQSNNSVIGPPAPTNDIGPGELSNFTLNGTITRPAERPPAARPAPPVVRPDVAPAPNTNRPAAAPPPVVATPPSADRPDPANSDLFRRPPTLPDASPSNAVTANPETAGEDRPAALPLPSDEGFSLLPWLVALLAVAGAGLMVFGRHRRQQRQAAASEASFESFGPDPVPEGNPIPASTRPAAATPSPAAAPTPVGTAPRRPLPTTLMPPAAVP